MPEIEVRIERLAADQLELAGEVMARIANNPNEYNVDEVEVPMGGSTAIAGRMLVHGDNPCQAAKAAVWKSLKALLDERGINLEASKGHTDALGTQSSITEDQIVCWPADPF